MIAYTMMNMNKRRFTGALLAMTLLSFIRPLSRVRAQVDITQLGPWKKFQTIGALINVLLPNILLIAGVSLFIIIMVLGFRMVQSAGSGDAEGTAQGKRALTYAIGGFVLIFAAYLIIQAVEFITGVKIFNPTLN